MEMLEVTSSAAGISKKSAQSTYKMPKGVISEYAKVLASKMSNIREDVREMSEIREQEEEISEMRAETNIICIETVRRYMPDGSIMVTTYEDGKIAEQHRKKPHMVVVNDYSAPPKADGTPETKLEAKQGLDLMELLMM